MRQSYFVLHVDVVREWLPAEEGRKSSLDSPRHFLPSLISDPLKFTDFASILSPAPWPRPGPARPGGYRSRTPRRRP